jgi:hypothetical protein
VKKKYKTTISSAFRIVLAIYIRESFKDKLKLLVSPVEKGK